MKTFPAKFAGTCSKCHERFAKGTTIAYDGKAWHPACLESEKATEERYYAEKEAADIMTRGGPRILDGTQALCNQLDVARSRRPNFTQTQ